MGEEQEEKKVLLMSEVIEALEHARTIYEYLVASTEEPRALVIALGMAFGMLEYAAEQIEGMPPGDPRALFDRGHEIGRKLRKAQSQGHTPRETAGMVKEWL